MIGITEEYARLPMILFAVMLVTGIYKIFIQDELETSANRFMKSISEDNYAKIALKQSGVRISSKGYYLILYVLAGVFLVLGVLKGIMYRNLGTIILGALIAYIIIIAFRPSEKIYGTLKSPFKTITDALSKSRTSKLDREIYSSCIVLKNLAIVQSEKPQSADKIYEILMDCSKLLKPLYQEMISLYRTGRREEAFKGFSMSIGTASARSYVALLSKIDRINPAELLDQVNSLLEAMSEKRLTDGIEKAQRNGAITITLSTLAIMAALGDFLIVVVYLDMLSGLNLVF